MFQREAQGLLPVFPWLSLLYWLGLAILLKTLPNDSKILGSYLCVSLVVFFAIGPILRPAGVPRNVSVTILA